MITAENLMVNNWVSYDGKPYQIFSTGGDFPTLNTIEFGAGVVDYNNIEPIPLSEKWILKLGFKYSEGLGKYYWYIPLHDLSIDKLTFVLKEGFICFEGIKYRSLFNHITFVHQLQNLMTALKQPITFKPTE